MMKSRKKTGRHAVRSAENSSYSGKSFTSPYDASAYSRHGNVEQYHDASRKQKKHHKRKVGMTVAAIFLVVVLVGVGVAFAFISNIDRNLQDGLDEDLLASLTASDSPSEPFYMLLIGVDKSEEREESDHLRRCVSHRLHDPYPCRSAQYQDNHGFDLSRHDG